MELPNIFAKPVPGAQAQIQEDFVGKAATLWPDKHVPGGSKGLGGVGLGQQVRSVSGKTAAGADLVWRTAPQLEGQLRPQREVQRSYSSVRMDGGAWLWAHWIKFSCKV